MMPLLALMPAAGTIPYYAIWVVIVAGIVTLAYIGLKAMGAPEPPPWAKQALWVVVIVVVIVFLIVLLTRLI